jgi:hypothetical protein
MPTAELRFERLAVLFGKRRQMLHLLSVTAPRDPLAHLPDGVPAMPLVTLGREFWVPFDPVRDEHVLEERPVQHPRLDAIATKRKKQRRLVGLARLHVCAQDRLSGSIRCWRPRRTVRSREVAQRLASLKLRAKGSTTSRAISPVTSGRGYAEVL